MLRIHQPYIKKRKVKYLFVLASMGAFLLGSLVVINNSSENSVVYAAGESRTLSDITTMQEMTQQICSNTDIGDTESLIDKRGTKISYKVIKMLDGTCWMAENLRLIDTKIDSTDSDMESGSFTVPASNIYSFNADSQYQPKVYYNDSTTYGAYYNWYTATAGSGISDIDGTINKSVANSSICPKGWKLPTYEGIGSFYDIINGVNGYKSGEITINGFKGYKLGFNSDNAFWPAAGNIYDRSHVYPGIRGFYWSRVAKSVDIAYYLYFDNNEVNPRHSSYRYGGFSVRCTNDPEAITKAPIWEESKDGNVNVNVPSILTIDATSGMDEIADSSKVIEGTATATISSNTEYAVTLHSTQPSLKDISSSDNTSTTNTYEISPVSESNPVQPGNNSWGLWNGTSGPKTYTLPITTTPTEFPNTSTSSITEQGNTTTHIYYVGISISPALPSGTYGTDVVVTASVK